MPGDLLRVDNWVKTQYSNQMNVSMFHGPSYDGAIVGHMHFEEVSIAVAVVEARNWLNRPDTRVNWVMVCNNSGRFGWVCFDYLKVVR